VTTTSAQKAIQHAQQQFDPFLDSFLDLLRIPSVSTDPAYKTDLERCAGWIVAEMTRIGFNNCQAIPTAGHPVIYGEWLQAGPDRPTILVYAHYDVQPVDPLDLWESPPFEPTSRDGKLYARGAQDDKSGVWANLKACEAILATEGKLPVNVKLFFEGEEEMGSPSMPAFLQAHKALLAADALLLCDGPFNPEQPIIAYALRGVVSAEVTVSGPDHDLHSGVYGGTVHNPLHLLGQIVGSFHDELGRVRIPGFYDRVRQLEAAELTAMQETWQLTGPKWEAEAGVTRFWGETIASRPERLTALPTLDVNGMGGGYQGPGMKTIIPARAGFKATMRLVADQDPREIGQMFRDYVLGFACDTLDIEVDILAEAWPLTTSRDDPAVEATQRTYETALVGGLC
jgi:acetylornithine deacetylase/succinyl-diaminopimelate desuccinylase-like protein